MWRWLDGIKKPEEQKEEAAEQKRKAVDTVDNENKGGGEMKKMRTYNTVIVLTYLLNPLRSLWN